MPEAKRIIEACRDIQAFREAQRLVRERGFGSIVGFDDLESLINQNGQPLIRALSEMYLDFVLHGRKHVYLFEPSDSARSTLRSLRPKLDKPELTTDWPWPPVLSNRLDIPILVRIETIGDTKHFVFGSHRLATVEERFESDWLSDAAPDYVRSTEITYKASKPTYVYDVVAVPKDGPVEVRIAGTTNPTRPKPHEVKTSILDRMTLMSSRGVTNDLFAGGLALGECVPKFYKARKEGRIYWLDFSCIASRAKRRERFSKHKPEDLRKETYHIAGTKAVADAIEIYGLGVSWELPGGRNATLEFHGTPTRMQDGVLTLYEAFVSNLASASEYNFLMERLRKYANGG